MTKGGKLIEGIFKGETINTPSMLCVEDALDGLDWAQKIGLQGLIARSENNLKLIADWVAKTPWVDFLAEREDICSCTSICLKISDGWFAGLNEEGQQEAVKKMTGLLEKENAAYDIGAYRDAPAGLRIWGGATVEASDIQALLPWLDWAFAEVKNAESKAA